MNTIKQNLGITGSHCSEAGISLTLSVCLWTNSANTIASQLSTSHDYWVKITKNLQAPHALSYVSSFRLCPMTYKQIFHCTGRCAHHFFKHGYSLSGWASCCQRWYSLSVLGLFRSTALWIRSNYPCVCSLDSELPRAVRIDRKTCPCEPKT